MPDKRKTIRITIPATGVEMFNHSKKRAENVARMKMTDIQYATAILCWAINEQEIIFNNSNNQKGKAKK